MIKVRSHRKIALLLVLAMLATMFVGMGTASAADDSSILTITKVVNTNVEEDTPQTLGYVKAAIDSDNLVAGTLVVKYELPDNVTFANDETTYDTTVTVDTAHTAYTLNVPDVTVDEAAADDINVGVTIKYVSSGTPAYKIAEYTGTLLLGQKGDPVVTATAGDPTSVAMNNTGAKTAKITLKENLPGALKDGSQVCFELPDDFAWIKPANITGNIGGTFSIDSDDNLILTISNPTPSYEDDISFTPYIIVSPDAAKGDVTVKVSDNGATADSNVADTDLTIATYGDSDITVTADDSTGAKDQIYTATEDSDLWTIKLESSGTFTVGDSIFLTLPEGVEFIKNDSTKTLSGCDYVRLYNDNRSMWLTVNSSASDKITIAGLTVGVTPTAKLGDLTVEVSGDVGTASVVAGTIKARVDVTAPKTNVKVGLGQVAGDITLKETVKDSLAGLGDIVLSLPSGVTFAADPTVEVNGDEITSNVINDKGALQITLSKLTSKIDTIVISGIKYDIDARYMTGNEITVKVGGVKVGTSNVYDTDDLNELTGTTDAQFEDEADDAVLTVANAVVYAGDAVQPATFVIGSSTYTQNGKEVAAVAASYASNNRSYLAIRDIAHVLGIDDSNILWDGTNQSVTLMKGDKVVQLKVGSNVILINGAAVTMDVAVQASNGRTFLPAAFVAQAFGATATWDAATNTVSIK